MVRVALSAVAERLSNMTKYDKFGVAKDGSVNPLREKVSTIMHMLSLASSPGFITREKADDLYRAIKTGKSHGGWKVTGSMAGFGGKGDGNGKDEEDEDNDKKRRAPGIRDIDFSMEGKMSRINPLRKPEEKTMKSGGLVRGAGCAQRGRGKGKMV